MSEETKIKWVFALLLSHIVILVGLTFYAGYLEGREMWKGVCAEAWSQGVILDNCIIDGGPYGK